MSDRSQKAAYQVIHDLKQYLRAGCVPVFSSDGLKSYFYGLTAHFGKWELVSGKRRLVWVLLSDLVYGQVVKHQRRRKLVKVEHRILCGDRDTYRGRLKAVGLSGKINSSFIERLNLLAPPATRFGRPKQVAGGLTNRRWTVKELISYPVY